MVSFIGRKKELEQLELLQRKKSSSLIVVKGRRRVGKSRLIREFASKTRFLRFSGIPPEEKITDQIQRDVFAHQLGEQLGLPGLIASDWADLFTLLAKQTIEGPVIILLDEISWMGSKDPTFLGKLKNAWDLEFSNNSQLIMVLCGSVSVWVEENILKNTAFFGRISLRMTLEELSLGECSQFLGLLGNGRRSPYETFKILAVTGGIPWYLEQIHGSLNADENIKNLCFRKNGVLSEEFDLIFHDLFSKKNEVYKKIVNVLSKGHLEFNQICQEVDYSKSGILGEYLGNLQEAGFVTRDFTWNIKDGHLSSLSHFRLSDNYLRFYLKYILPIADKISRDEFADVSMTSLLGWDTIMGLQFENLVLKNRKEVRKILRIRPEDVVLDNPFFQRKSTKCKGCQIDYLIQTRFKTLYVCEIKFSRNEIKVDIVEEVKNKIERLALPRGFAVCPVLIHVNGVHDAVVDSNYFSEIIDFSLLLE